ncbi:hypothetical protein GALMADRAFT_147496 [Galerina marginata CBS 339.88]|uniref:Uncharacterized protein n=1 Tax=Galerina marginata (strain CBS 339.88) TaxID=685588 RepID=A0A067SAT1_GALM3|nr:hypothetical protein GALMADRAFT_147496 [Galerina marginata CBS 339.88]
MNSSSPIRLDKARRASNSAAGDFNPAWAFYHASKPSETVTKTQARREYKLTDDDIAKLTPVSTSRNPWGTKCYHFDFEEVFNISVAKEESKALRRAQKEQRKKRTPKATQNAERHAQLEHQPSSSSSFGQGIQQYAYKGASNNRAVTPPRRQSSEVVEIPDSPPRRKRSRAGEISLGFIDLTID